jgi:hypothetical protein
MDLANEVDSFLKEFKQKAKTFEINYYPRKKNTEALLQLETTAKRREQVIMSLTTNDYYQGPTKDTNPGMPDYYEFGTVINGIEVYIKLSLGKFDKSPACMSFHPAEHKMNYPLR